MMKYSFWILCSALLLFASCKEKKEGVAETRTSGTMTMLVDDSFAGLIDDQVQVFNLDYPNATITQIRGSEGKILTNFLNDTTRFIIMSRMLTDAELKMYANRKIRVNTDRFAIDGIALITNRNNIDTNITVQELINIMKGSGSRGKSLVFDNAYSSTLRYFKELAGVSQVPPTGVFTLSSNLDVINFVAKDPNYIGVVGLNWLLEQNDSPGSQNSRIVLMNVKNLPGKKGDDKYYKPLQEHLISGKYPLLRNIYVTNAEGRDGLGTGFATWLTSHRGQLIVLRSGLGPHKLAPRAINLKTKK